MPCSQLNGPGCQPEPTNHGRPVWKTAPKYNTNKLSCSLAKIADTNSTTYKQLDEQEVNKLITKPRCAYLADNMRMRGLVVYQQISTKSHNIFVFDDEGELECHISMKDLIIHLLSRPAPKVKVTSDAVARRAATTQARGDERLRLPRRTDDGSAELRAAAARGEVKLVLPSRVDDGSAELRAAAERGEVELRLPSRIDDGSAELRAAAERGEVKLTKQYFASYEAQKQERRAALILGWKEERPAAEQEAAAQKLVADLVGPLLALLDEAAGDRYFISAELARGAPAWKMTARCPPSSVTMRWCVRCSHRTR